MKRRRFRPRGAGPLFVLAILALVTAACGGPVADPPEVLVLRSVASDPLPAPMDERIVPGADGDEVHRIEATEGRLILFVDGGYELRLGLYATVDGVQVPPVRLLDRGSVASSGETLEFASEVIEDLTYDGVRAGSGAVVRFDLVQLVGQTAVSELDFTAP